MIKNALHGTSVFSHEVSHLAHAVYQHLLCPDQKRRETGENNRGKNCREKQIPKPFYLPDKE